MSFPISPIEGQIYKEYKYETDRWVRNVNSDILGGIDSTSFLRSDVDDTMTVPLSIDIGVTSEDALQVFSDTSGNFNTFLKNINVDGQGLAVQGGANNATRRAFKVSNFTGTERFSVGGNGATRIDTNAYESLVINRGGASPTITFKSDDVLVNRIVVKKQTHTSQKEGATISKAKEDNSKTKQFWVSL